MTISAGETTIPVEHTDRFFIGGQWVTPSTDSKIDVIDSHTEQVCLTVAEAQAADMDRAVTAAKEAFDRGPWPRLTHAERASYLRALGEEVVKRSADIVQLWPREAGVLAAMARGSRLAADLWDAPSRARARLSAPPLAACSRLPRLEVTLRLHPLCPDLSGWSQG